MTRYAMMFDVESVGLHGEGFAVGAVIFDLDQPEYCPIETFYAACPPDLAGANDRDTAFLVDHVISHLRPDYGSAEAVRKAFWNLWLRWKAKGCTLWSDCGWPVEANFLSACVADCPEARFWKGPYPLLDLATAQYMEGIDASKAKYPRLRDELPEHDPLADARQSARLLYGLYRFSNA